MSSVFVVQSKNSAGPNSVSVQFVEYADSNAMNAYPPGQVVQSFTLMLPQEESNNYEINSKWERTLTAVTDSTTEAPADPSTTATSTTTTP